MSQWPPPNSCPAPLSITIQFSQSSTELETCISNRFPSIPEVSGLDYRARNSSGPFPGWLRLRNDLREKGQKGVLLSLKYKLHKMILAALFRDHFLLLYLKSFCLHKFGYFDLRAVTAIPESQEYGTIFEM